MNINIKELTIAKAHECLKKGDITAVELAGAYLKEAEAKNKDVNAFIEIFDDVKRQAEKADKMFAEGKAGPLTGIPLAIKDCILIHGKKATAGSKILEGYKATYDATVIAKLKSAGAVFLGRANMDEFAMGGSTETSCYGITKNPHDLERVPGGSSGGSAAAVAMGGALGALGSDTGGSIRQPGAFCGVVGLKPTYGAVSRYGLMAMASSFDQIGPLVKTVEDSEILFNVISGYDKMDSTSVPEDVQKKYERKKEKKLYTIGVPADFVYTDGVDKGVVKNFKEALEYLKSLGHTIKEIKLPNLKYSLAAYYVIMPAEASTNLARYDGVRFGLLEEGKDLFEDYAKTRGVGFGKEVRRRIILGTYVLSSGYYDAYYNKAVAVRNVIRKDFEETFKDVDILATPTAPTPAFKIGEKIDDPLQMYLEDIFTVPANLTGVPAISVPSGKIEIEGKKIPLAMQFFAPHFHEATLFAIGKDLEKRSLKL
ncbi:MAG: Asp-tRNA(Asn)/Glu-tRNA(Gln) amidotransferase subunit GatA [Candidatus Pacebacteria bacterium]|nr:Asp-tRNA(Asn)/Glu-tRNA(Gln) amidotransferase subunit GatA [Candidatus Paceibacterota bacterium]